MACRATTASRKIEAVHGKRGAYSFVEDAVHGAHKGDQRFLAVPSNACMVAACTRAWSGPLGHAKWSCAARRLSIQDLHKHYCENFHISLGSHLWGQRAIVNHESTAYNCFIGISSQRPYFYLLNDYFFMLQFLNISCNFFMDQVWWESMKTLLKHNLAFFCPNSFMDSWVEGRLVIPCLTSSWFTQFYYSEFTIGLGG
jgi:hypothetical protein